MLHRGTCRLPTAPSGAGATCAVPAWPPGQNWLSLWCGDQGPLQLGKCPASALRPSPEVPPMCHSGTSASVPAWCFRSPVLPWRRVCDWPRRQMPPGSIRAQCPPATLMGSRPLQCGWTCCPRIPRPAPASLPRGPAFAAALPPRARNTAGCQAGRTQSTWWQQVSLSLSHRQREAPAAWALPASRWAETRRICLPVSRAQPCCSGNALPASPPTRPPASWSVSLSASPAPFNRGQSPVLRPAFLPQRPPASPGLLRGGPPRWCSEGLAGRALGRGQGLLGDPSLSPQMRSCTRTSCRSAPRTSRSSSGDASPTCQVSAGPGCTAGSWALATGSPGWDRLSPQGPLPQGPSACRGSTVKGGGQPCQGLGLFLCPRQCLRRGVGKDRGSLWLCALEVRGRHFWWWPCWQSPKALGHCRVSATPGLSLLLTLGSTLTLPEPTVHQSGLTVGSLRGQ